MVGKHIFVRCFNDQKNAGTWTAAMTEGIVEKGIVRDSIEPRCNMDETFAQESLIDCPSNNVLRLYYVDEDTLVITRTYWVTDRITSAQGRRGAYSVSYILTDDDVARFFKNYAGAFDTDCFESYDSLVARVKANGDDRVTISDEGDIFEHRSMEVDQSILTHCGFTKESFVAFMNGLYDAVENQKQVAVILPDALRKAWAKSGDDSAERLVYFILGLLPDFMRINVGFVSHWNCKVKDTMVSDMPLIFAHPSNEEEFAMLRRDGVHIVDLDTGRFNTDIPSVAPDYFSFIWDSISDSSVREEFWIYCKTNYQKLLRGRPTSAEAMECIYLIRKTMAEKYSDLERCNRAFLLSVEVFAGAGTKVSIAEEFISGAIAALGFEKTDIDKNTEAAVCNLVLADREKTKHQAAEYKILLNCIERGTASPDTLKALLGELNKENRDVASYFKSYLEGKQDAGQANISAQMTELVAEIFDYLYKNDKLAELGKLAELLLSLVDKWTKELIGTNRSWQELITPFVVVFGAYLKSSAANSEYTVRVYEYLFFLFRVSSEETYEACKDILFKEEGRLYRNLNGTLDNGNLRIGEYAKVFFLNIQATVESGNKDVINTCYERLFRMTFNPIEAVSKEACTVYVSITQKLLNAIPNSADKILAVVLNCQEQALTALAEISDIWSSAPVEKIMIATETVNLEMYGSYVPTMERTGFVLAYLNNSNNKVYPLLEKYTEVMPFDVRQSLYSELKNRDFIERFFAYMFLYTDKEEIKAEIIRFLNLSHTKILGTLDRYQDVQVETDASVRRFSDWYSNDLMVAANNIGKNFIDSDYSAVFNFINKEISIHEELMRNRTGIYNAANEIFVAFLHKVFSDIPDEIIEVMPTTVVKEIMNIRARFIYRDELRNENVFKRVIECDSIISSEDTGRLSEITDGCLQNDKMRNFVKYRMDLKREEKAFGSEFACRLYYAILASNVNNSFPLNDFLVSYSYESMSDKEKSMLLIKILTQLNKDKSSMEYSAGEKTMVLLSDIANQNSSIFFEKDFLSLYMKIKPAEYVRRSRFVSIMNIVDNNNKSLKFDLRMLCFTLIGLVVCSSIMGLLSFGVILLAKISPVVMIIVASIVFLAICTADIFMLANLLNSKKRR